MALTLLLFSPANLVALLVFGLPYVAARRAAARRQIFTLHLRACVRLQLPLAEALENCGGAPREVARIMRKTADLLYEGMTLSAALGCSWACLPTWYTRMLELGERNGNLAGMLDRILETDRREEELRLDFCERLVYPLLVCFFVSYIGNILFMFIIPTFSRMLREVGAPDVSFTGIAVGLFLANLVGLLLLVAILAAVPVAWGPNLERAFGGFFTLLRFVRRHTPVIGRQYRRAACARWATTTGLLLEAGDTLPAAAGAAAELEADAAFRDRAELWAERLEGGATLREVMRHERVFPRGMAWQIAAADGTAALPETLRLAGERETRNFDRSFAIWLRLLTPALVLLVGYVVAKLCLGLFGSLIGIIYGMLEAIP